MNTRRRSAPTPTNDMTIDVALVERLLAEQNMTWTDLANKMGVSKSSISRVVRYESQPSAPFIFAIMRIFPQYRDVLFVPMPERTASA